MGAQQAGTRHHAGLTRHMVQLSLAISWRFVADLSRLLRGGSKQANAQREAVSEQCAGGSSVGGMTEEQEA